MQSETEIILLTSNNMEGNGCKSFIELNKPGCKISLMLLFSDYDFVPPKVNLDKFIKANKVVKMTGVVIDFSSIPVA